MDIIKKIADIILIKGMIIKMLTVYSIILIILVSCWASPSSVILTQLVFSLFSGLIMGGSMLIMAYSPKIIDCEFNELSAKIKIGYKWGIFILPIPSYVYALVELISSFFTKDIESYISFLPIIILLYVSSKSYYIIEKIINNGKE